MPPNLKQTFSAGGAFQKFRIALLLFSALLVTIGGLGTAALLFYFHLQAQPKVIEPVRDTAHEQTPHEIPPFHYSLELKNFSLGIANKQNTRSAYAQFTLVLDLPSEASVRAMELNRAKLRDAIFEAGISFRVEEFSKPEGFARFKAALLDRMRSEFAENAPRQIAIRDWLLQ